MGGDDVEVGEAGDSVIGSGAGQSRRRFASLQCLLQIGFGLGFFGGVLGHLESRARGRRGRSRWAVMMSKSVRPATR
jgi:hypothetical protein